MRGEGDGGGKEGIDEGRGVSGERSTDKVQRNKLRREGMSAENLMKLKIQQFGEEKGMNFREIYVLNP